MNNQLEQFQQLIAAGGAVIILGLVVAAIGRLAAVIFYLLTLQRAISRCSPECRAMPPGLVWLYLIPCAGIIWNFFLVINVARSLGKEFRKRGIAVNGNPTFGIGLTMAILLAVSIIPYVNCLTLPAWFVFLIIYWVKVAGCSKQLA